MATALTSRSKLKGKFPKEAVGEVIEVELTSDGSGDASQAVPDVHGFLVKVITQGDGTDSPTADWDLTLVETSYGASLDALGGDGADRHTTNTEVIAPVDASGATPVYLHGNYTVTGANMGDTKSATVWLFVHGGE